MQINVKSSFIEGGAEFETQSCVFRFVGTGGGGITPLPHRLFKRLAPGGPGPRPLPGAPKPRGRVRPTKGLETRWPLPIGAPFIPGGARSSCSPWAKEQSSPLLHRFSFQYWQSATFRTKPLPGPFMGPLPMMPGKPFAISPLPKTEVMPPGAPSKDLKRS